MTLLSEFVIAVSCKFFMAVYFFLQYSIGVLYGIMVASVSMTKFQVINQFKENWEI
jgi:hypothetical protein